MKTQTLYRPIGKGELILIEELNFDAFPPRLDWQPIFYPVLNQAYAENIALDWNTKDEFSGYVGLVTKFNVNAEYAASFKVENVGDKHHNELWVPAEQMKTFNENIIGKIEIVKVFFGEKFESGVHSLLDKLLTESVANDLNTKEK
ncbi:MAG: ADP-ribosylation/crystallin J1 [Crocinitomix sp.]|nr:ADP-ribosylation/crystallin J1 [Crocinitomix sp.]